MPLFLCENFSGSESFFRRCISLSPNPTIGLNILPELSHFIFSSSVLKIARFVLFLHRKSFYNLSSCIWTRYIIGLVWLLAFFFRGNFIRDVPIVYSNPNSCSRMPSSAVIILWSEVPEWRMNHIWRSSVIHGQPDACFVLLPRSQCMLCPQFCVLTLPLIWPIIHVSPVLKVISLGTLFKYKFSDISFVKHNPCFFGQIDGQT
jgi:hypothetical protein